MQWELMTSPQLGRAARDPGVCVLTLGVLERHSDHLALGTDYISAHAVARLAAEKEPAVVFPPFYFGQIYEARAFPGAVTLRPTLLLDLLQSVLDEIGRNGFKKIVLSSGHGGNNGLVEFLKQCALWEEKPYMIYIAPGGFSGEREKRLHELLPPDSMGHACAWETSLIMANAPEGVDMSAMPDHAARPLGRLDHLAKWCTAVSWYADFPEHYMGDARLGTAEIGREVTAMMADELAEFLAKVKADQVAPALQAEYFALERGLRE